MPTVQEIADLAFDGVAGAIEGVVKTATLYSDERSTWNSATGQYDVTPDQQQGDAGRGLVDSSMPVKDRFPDYVDGPARQVLFLNGMTVRPREGWTVDLGGTNYRIDAVSDVVGSGTTFYVAVY